MSFTSVPLVFSNICPAAEEEAEPEEVEGRKRNWKQNAARKYVNALRPAPADV